MVFNNSNLYKVSIPMCHVFLKTKRKQLHSKSFWSNCNLPKTS